MNSPSAANYITAIDASRPAGRKAGWVYALAWLPWFAVYLAAMLTNRVPLDLALRNAVVGVLPNALLGAAVLRLPRHLSWSEERRWRFFAAHVLFMAVFIAGAMSIWAVLGGLDALIFTGNFDIPLNLRFATWSVLSNILIYATLAGFAYAWHHAAVSREQAARAARAEALRARAELEALRSQLNPHFIMNTLHALLGLVKREPATAEIALERLGDLLRYSLRIQREGLDEVTLREEWSFVQTYLELERLRLGDRLRVTFDAVPAALDCMIPSFSLQTLVENSVRHGIALRAGGGTLGVRVSRTGDGLRIEVEDEGVGTKVQPQANGQGVGLTLLRERLAGLYEGGASLALHEREGGHCAVLEVPGRSGLEQS